MVPTSEILRYAIDLRSMTHGRGSFTVTHSHYDPVPGPRDRQDHRRAASRVAGQSRA